MTAVSFTLQILQHIQFPKLSGSETCSYSRFPVLTGLISQQSPRCSDSFRSVLVGGAIVRVNGQVVSENIRVGGRREAKHVGKVGKGKVSASYRRSRVGVLACGMLLFNWRLVGRQVASIAVAACAQQKAATSFSVGFDFEM